MTETSSREKEELDIANRQMTIAENRRRGAGGTPGGLGTFFVGFILAIAGGYLVLNQVQVTSTWGFFNWMGVGRQGGFGLTMLPLLIGVGILFVNFKNILGRLLVLAGVVMIVASILMNMSIHWQTTSLFNTLFMFTMFAAGIGLIFRSFKSFEG